MIGKATLIVISREDKIMSNIDFNAAGFEPLHDEIGTSTTAKAGSSKRAGFGGGKKKNQGPSLNVKKGGKGPSAKVSKPTKTSGKFGGKGMK